MKKPLIVFVAILMGVIATNMVFKKRDNVASDPLVEDKIETSQAAAIPL